MYRPTCSTDNLATYTRSPTCTERQVAKIAYLLYDTACTKAVFYEHADEWCVIKTTLSFRRDIERIF